MSLIFHVPAIDPIAFSFGFVAIRWYSLAYIFGILAALIFLKKANKDYQIMSKEAEEDWLTWAILGIILGGRIGYILFYNFSFYIENPLDILKIWQGGMSFHGGLLGVIFAMFVFCKKNQINFLKLTDILSVIAPVGIFFGRLANFINMELYGRITNSENYGFIFSTIDNQKRHPSQLYEAFFEGVLLFIILLSLRKWQNFPKNDGILSGIFIILYSLARMFVEQFREPDAHLGFVIHNITMGQMLSLPIFIFGLGLVIFRIKEKRE